MVHNSGNNYTLSSKKLHNNSYTRSNYTLSSKIQIKLFGELERFWEVIFISVHRELKNEFYMENNVELHIRF